MRPCAFRQTAASVRGSASGTVPALLLGLILALATAPTCAPAQDRADARMLADPAMSAGHLAFVYDGDLWIAERDGDGARRLTTHPGNESAPAFSPDGRWLAFSGEYDGNTDVFVVPVEGGAPRRLTWHPAADQVRGWTPDGRAVLFVSPRDTHFFGLMAAMSVDVESGALAKLEAPNAFHLQMSPAGDRLAYTPLLPAMAQWKHYRGGRVSRIWLLDRDDRSVVEVPQPEGRSNDLDPFWIGDRLYFVSDRAGEFNLFAFDEGGGTVEQLTRHDDFPILAASPAPDGAIVYEQGGGLHTLDTRTGRAARIRVAVTTDLVETRPRWATGARFLRNFHLSPSGARAVFEYRGDVVTVPAEKGDVRALTSTPGTHERSPAWSPDGTRIAYFSDASGEYALHVAPQDGRGEPRVYELSGAGFYDDPKWSPDGSRISFTDNAWTLRVLDVGSGDVREVAAEPLYGPFKTITHAWSPDSKWIAYTLTGRTYFTQVHVWSVESGRSHAVGSGLAHVREPVFDRSGKYLWFYASTNAGPVQQWFAMSNADMRASGTLYLAVLAEGEESPLKPESDEEAGGEDEAAEEADPGEEGRQEGEEEDEEEGAATTIDLERLDQRVVALGVGDGWFGSLQAGADGELYYLRGEAFGGFSGPGQTSLRRFRLSEREEETLLERADAFTLSGDGKKMLVHSGENWHIAPVGEVDAATTRIATGDIRVRVEPRAEWEQMLREAWRIQRDWFYDPAMHGADWDAMWDKYAAFLPHLATRADLNRVTQWMLSELAVGHSGGGGGDFLRDAEAVPSGLLGADLEVADGRWRFRRVYGGLNWNPELRAPLTEPGVDVRAGEYLLAVEGVELRAPVNPYAPFENRADEQVRITVGPNADGSGSRTVTVVPVASENALRNRAWVEDNVRKVHEATDGRVAYVWVPNTTTNGWEYFKRYFYPQAHLDAIIVDERHNGGGQLADYVIDLLRRRYVASWATRYGEDISTPIAAIPGPKVMLIDEYAGSGGDFMPWMFRQFELGPLIGRRTWGGLVGILGTPVLMDGASWTAPNLGFWTEEEGFGIENVGIPPDIEVEQDPAAVAGGADPQLERAIEEVNRRLEASPRPERTRPAFPVRVRR
jgi:tricorn protease